METSFKMYGGKIKFGLKRLYIFLFIIPIVFFASGVVTLFSLLTLFYFRNFTMVKLVAPFCRAILYLVGVRIRYFVPKFEFRQKVYICNHLSALDIFIMCGLGIPNTRYFMSVSTLKFPPLLLVGLCTGVFYVSEQANGKKRTQEFKKACNKLMITKESVMLTPEGFRNKGTEIQKFNKGSFHLATVLKCDIECFVIEYPPKSNPGLGLVAESGTINVRHIGTFSTANWSLDRLSENADMVRDHYLKNMKNSV